MAEKMQRFVSQPSENGSWVVAVYNKEQRNYIPMNGEVYPSNEASEERARDLNLQAKEDEQEHDNMNALISILVAFFLTLSMWSCTNSNSNPTNIPTEYCEELVKLAENGNPKAQVNLALCYSESKGVKQNFSEAVKWLGKAVEQNDPEAMYWLSIAYNRGIGVEQSDVKSIELLRKSAELGWVQSQLELGGCYRGGLGVQPDYEESLKWYTKAAENGNPEAQYNLGMMYSDKGDYVTAVSWFQKSADQNCPEGQTLLGLSYFNGLGVQQDQEKGIELLEKAANQGCEIAIKNLEYCRNNR